MSHILLKNLLNELISDIFSEKEKKGIMPQNEWDELDEDNSPEKIQKKIKYVRGLSDECRQYAMENHSDWKHDVGSGKVSGLKIHPDLQKKLDEEGLQAGFSMGVDKNGYYIHTHRGRSKSRTNPAGFTKQEIKFVNSTG